MKGWVLDNSKKTEATHFGSTPVVNKVSLDFILASNRHILYSIPTGSVEIYIFSLFMVMSTVSKAFSSFYSPLNVHGNDICSMITTPHINLHNDSPFCNHFFSLCFVC